MSNCLITLKPLTPSEQLTGYSVAGLRYLTGSSRVSMQLPFTRSEFFSDLPIKQQGMSISGYQPKLSLKIENDQFEVTSLNGTYLLKPSPEQYPHLAENEHATMQVMKALGFNIPPCGLASFKQAGPNVEYAFLIQRYDRNPKTGERIMQEQLDGSMNVDDKYGLAGGNQTISYSMLGRFIINNILGLQIKKRFFRQVLYAYLLANNDLHLRNFSLIRPETERDQISPVYDFVSTAPYPSTYTASYLALPLRDEEINNDDEDNLVCGFNSPHGEYVGYDFIQFGLSIGLSEKIARRFLLESAEDAEMVRQIYKNSFMPQKHIDAVLECFNHRLNKIQIFEL